MNNKHIIIFDGVCNFCNSSVNFIIKHDHNDVFVFASLQSPVASKLIADYKVKDVGFDTFLLIKNNECFLRTNAALEIVKDFNGAWSLLRVLKIIPRPIRDYFYRLFARNRYAIFGKADYCRTPTPEIKGKFL